MNRCKNKRLKLNNAGMSLIELLVAIAIMAVALVPLLFSFVNVARYNARAREIQQTTALAHTVMENCKAYSMEDINDKMVGAVNGGTFLTGVTKAQTYYDLSTTTYYMTDVVAENGKYDIVLEFTPHSFGAAGDTSYDILYTPSMNPYLDAVFTAQGTKELTTNITAAEADQHAYLDAFEKISAAIETQTKNELGDANKVTLTTSYIENSFKDSSDPNYGHFSIKRESYIRLYELGLEPDTEERVEVVIRYTFELTGGKYVYKHVDALGNPKNYEWTYNAAAHENEIEYEYHIYNNYATDSTTHPTRIENVYFFYYPAYQGTLSLYPFTSDYIQISNDLADGDNPADPNNRRINIYLIKQKNPAYSDANLSTLETSYKVSVKGYNTGGADPDINIFHNLDVNIGGGGSTPYDVNTWFNNVTKVMPKLAQTDNKTLMYDISLKIYNAGAYDMDNHLLDATAQPVLTMDGTTLDW